MKNKCIFCIIIVVILFLSVSAISADENITDTDDANTTSPAVYCSTEMHADNVTSYSNVNDKFEVTLTSNGTALSNKSVEIILNNVAYNKTTDTNGKASVNFKLAKGTYRVSYYFSGDENYTASNGTATIIIKTGYATVLKVADKNINYRQGLKSIFQLRLVDVKGNAVSGQKVVIKVGSKKYTITTNAKGYASIYLSLSKGTYKISYSFSGNGTYLASSGTFKITVRAKMAKGYAYWVTKWSVKKVNLKTLSKKGTKHIFLHSASISYWGKTYILKWIKKAKNYGIKVHIWMHVFYINGKWHYPVSKKGVYDYTYINKKIKEAKSYAALSGVSGVQFDYVRFPGDAYKYTNAAKAVNYFIKKASIAVHKVNSNCIVSATVMPEPSAMKYYYGQDIAKMSKYLDVIVPMIYKGNYGKTTSWIKSITKTFVKKSNGALIWSGLQSYKSDSNVKKLSYSALFKDAKAAINGGASGVVLFRWGLSQLLNFKKL